MKKWLFLTLVFLIVIGGGYWWFRPTVTPPPTVAVKKGDIKETVMAMGVIVPEHIIQVKSQLSGNVGHILVHDGARVKKGQRLLEIAPNPTPDNYAELLSQLQKASSDLEKATQHYHRYQVLLKNKATSADDFEQAKNAYEQAKAAQTLAAQKLALLQQGKTKIGNRIVQNHVVSPIDGYVLQTNVDTGDAIVPVNEYQQGTPLFMIANMNDLEFVGEVSQIDVGRLKLAQPALLEIAALPDLKLKGQLSNIALQAATKNDNNIVSSLLSNSNNIQNGFMVKVTGFKLPSDVRLRSGYQATATITIKEAKNVLYLPTSAINYESENKAFVFTPAEHQESEKHYIKTGLSDDINTEVISGLTLGQKVLVRTPSQHEN